MQRIVALNRGDLPYSWDSPVVPWLEAEDVEQLLSKGIQVLDIRPRTEFATGHIPGSLHVEVGLTDFEQSVGWIMPSGREFICVAESKESADLAVRKLAFVGLDRQVQGVVDLSSSDGIISLVSLPEISVQQLQSSLRNCGIQILDVREMDEWATGRIESACHMSFKLLPTRFSELPIELTAEIAVICEGGTRSATACSILRNAGFRSVSNVKGGMTAWIKAGFPIL